VGKAGGGEKENHFQKIRKRGLAVTNELKGVKGAGPSWQLRRKKNSGTVDEKKKGLQKKKKNRAKGPECPLTHQPWNPGLMRGGGEFTRGVLGV